MDLVTIIGFAAAFFTTVSYLPQLIKVWRTRETDDLSVKMLLALGTGLCLWIVYGAMQPDWAIIVANTISLTFLAIILQFKIRALMKTAE